MIFRMGAGDSRVNIGQGDPLIAQDEFAHLVGVFRTARFDDAEHAIPFPSLTDVREVNPSVRNCRELAHGTKLLRAEHTGERERLRTLDDLDASALRLREICLIVLDRSHTDSELRAAIFTRISREQLEKDVATIGALSREDHGNYFEHLCNHYGQVRRFLPRLLREIHFEGNRAGQSVLEALEFLKRLEDSPQVAHSGCTARGSEPRLAPVTWL